MPAMLPSADFVDQISDSPLAGANHFGSRSVSLADQFGLQTWAPDQPIGGESQLDISGAPELHDPIPDNIKVVDFSSISASPEAVRLRGNLHAHGQNSGTLTVAAPRRMSILDFPPLSLGQMLRPLSPDDDLLGEMLNEAWS
jgi:hypothetical protein